ncbi:MAG: hypothetical protein U9P10_14120 [Thermodesulfobacteriota bacterium]|nr:hypothetical protein [Thermodesulfobacteriota bacterium]
MEELEKFVDQWEETESQTKKAFQTIMEHLMAMADVTLEFHPRPGLTYSLRPRHKNQKDRTLFAMADVIDDDPGERWLSVCFYGDMISDPEEMGDLIPEGLLGDDGHCFDLYAYDEEEISYIKERLDEAYKSAAQS